MNDKTHTYEYDIDLNSDTAPAQVISMIREKSTVLEIGAGPGSITKRLIETKGCKVVALEVETSALEKLKKICDSVYSLDLNVSGWNDKILNDHGRFDYVIAADVLEHVYDPWRVLGEMKSLLNPSGSVVLSLPHAAHCAVLACMVDEDIEYRDWGLLDRTHIRFFGIKNIEDLYRNQGLAIEEVKFVVRTGEMTEFATRWKKLPTDIRSALTRNPFSTVYQVVSRAVPVERCKNPVDLMSQPVELPPSKIEKKVRKIREKIMRYFTN